MKHILLKLFFLFLVLIPISDIQAQGRSCERTYSGTMTDDGDESPLPGVNVVIKGTSQGTVTDVSGKYQIKVCPGDILVFTYIGYSAVEIMVTEEMLGGKRGKGKRRKVVVAAGGMNRRTEADIPRLYPRHENEKKLTLQELLKEKEVKVKGSETGTKSFSKDSPIFLNDGDTTTKRYYDVNNIKLTPGGGAYNVKSIYYKGIAYRTNIEWLSSIQFDKVGKQPELQQQYAQGRSENGELTWKGATDNEVFSWGPLVSSLEYDGNATPYNTNGSLVPAFSGNGEPAQAFNANDLLQTSISRLNLIQFGGGGETRSFNVKYRNLAKRNAFFPSININQHDFYANGWKRFRSPFTISSQVYYSNAQNFPFSNGAVANLIGSTYLTPVNFDNAAGLGISEAGNATTTYQLADGRPRSFAPNTFDNPFWLLENNPNASSTNRLIGSAQVRYDITDRINLSYQAGVDLQHQKNNVGIAPFSATMPEGRLTNRSERMRQYTSQLLLQGRFSVSDDLQAESKLMHSFTHTNRDLNRLDGEGFPLASGYELAQASRQHRQDIDQSRSIHQLIAEIEGDYKSFLFMKLTGQVYGSSTLGKAKVLLPSVSATVDLTTAIPAIQDSDLVSYLKVYSSYSTAMKEANLAYGSFHYQSTQQSLEEAFNFFGSAELSIPNNLQAKEVQSVEVGIESNLFNGRVGLNTNYFHKYTKNVIYPVWTGSAFELQNVGEIRNEGLEIYFSSDLLRAGDFTFYLGGDFNISRPVVSKLYGQRDRLPLAGFAEVSTNLIEGEPFGVIVGTAYQKNASGQTIIGADGYPLVDQNTQIIGNPNPNFRGRISPQFSYKGIELSLSWTFQSGGEHWNGTQRALDYYGRSAVTGTERMTRNYLFEGVLEDGSPNTQTVNFYNPADGLEGNRWVREGLAGVGSEYIQKTSWLRLADIQLSYTFSRSSLERLPLNYIQIVAYARNLFLNTPYTGVDPESSLFGYAEGNGLDYFNTPSPRQYGMRLKLTF